MAVCRPAGFVAFTALTKSSVSGAEVHGCVGSPYTKLAGMFRGTLEGTQRDPIASPVVGLATAALIIVQRFPDRTHLVLNVLVRASVFPRDLRVDVVVVSPGMVFQDVSRPGPVQNMPTQHGAVKVGSLVQETGEQDVVPRVTMAFVQEGAAPRDKFFQCSLDRRAET